jgi:Zn-dependent protease with chaperone function
MSSRSIVNLFASHPPTEKRIASLARVEATLEG